MAHDQVEILLGEMVEGSSPGQDAHQVFMGAFHSGFLVGHAGVTVVDPGTPLTFPIEFNRLGIGELGSVVGQKNGEEPAKDLPAQALIKPIEDVDDGLGGISLTQEQEQHR